MFHKVISHKHEDKTVREMQSLLARKGTSAVEQKKHELEQAIKRVENLTGRKTLVLSIRNAVFFMLLAVGISGGLSWAVTSFMLKNTSLLQKIDLSLDKSAGKLQTAYTNFVTITNIRYKDKERTVVNAVDDAELQSLRKKVKELNAQLELYKPIQLPK